MKDSGGVRGRWLHPPTSKQVMRKEAWNGRKERTLCLPVVYFKYLLCYSWRILPQQLATTSNSFFFFLPHNFCGRARKYTDRVLHVVRPNGCPQFNGPLIETNSFECRRVVHKWCLSCFYRNRTASAAACRHDSHTSSMDVWTGTRLSSGRTDLYAERPSTGAVESHGSFLTAGTFGTQI